MMLEDLTQWSDDADEPIPFVLTHLGESWPAGLS